jgi:arylsulfatase A-like enzyme
MTKTRREFLKAVAAGLVARAAAGGRTPSNVLLIIVDDLRPVMGCYGGKAITPNIDQFARTGVLFEHHYVQWPVCGPSRASLLGGLRPDSTGIYGNMQARKIADRPQTHPTLPLHFRNSAYITLSFGKTYHDQGSSDGSGWSAPPWHPASGWTCYVNFPAAPDGTPLKKTNGQEWKPAYEIFDGPDGLHNDYQTADRTIKALESQREKPFFIAAGFYKPHLPFVAPRRYWDLYDHSPISLTGHPGLPKGAADFMYRYAEIWSYGIEPGVLFAETKAPTEEQGRNLIRAYYAAVSFIDAQIGRILRRLEELALSDNTAVVIWGDNGFHLGDHARWAKHTQFENAMRTPLLVRFPGKQKAGVISSALVETVDIYPSLCDYAGLSLPKHLEGLTFLPIVRGDKHESKTGAYSQIRPVPVDQQHLVAYSVRTQGFRYVEWRDAAKRNEVVWRELYNHETDPDETASVADDPRYSAALKHHAQLVLEGYTSITSSRPSPALN